MKRRILISILLVCLIPLCVFARPSVALVLSGGGARGYVHIATLKMIEEYNIPVDYVVGTSMGAIIGGLFAAGYNADDIEEIIEEYNIPDAVFNLSLTNNSTLQNDIEQFNNFFTLSIDSKGNIGTTGVVNDIKVLCILDEIFALSKTTHDFDKLPRAFRAVAANVVNGETEVLKDGDLATAIRASMGIPMAFPVFERDGKFLVDGGVNNNMPVDIAISEFNPDIIISSDCTNEFINRLKGRDIETKLKKNTSSINDIVNQITSLSDVALYDSAHIRDVSDVAVFYDTTSWTVMSFTDVGDIIDYAHHSALKYDVDFLAIRNRFNEDELFDYGEKGVYSTLEEPLIVDVVSKGNERYRKGVSASIVNDLYGIVGKRLTRKNLAELTADIKTVANFYNASTFYYTLDNTDKGCVMNLYFDFPVFKQHSLSIGVNTEFAAQIKVKNTSNIGLFSVPFGLALKYDYLLSPNANLDSLSLLFATSSLFENTSFTLSYSHLFNMYRPAIGFVSPFLVLFAKSPVSITSTHNFFKSQNYGFDIGSSVGYMNIVSDLDITLGLRFMYFGKGAIESSKRSLSLLPQASLSIIFGTIRDQKFHYKTGYQIYLNAFMGVDLPVARGKQSGDLNEVQLPFSALVRAVGVYSVAPHCSLSVSAECGVSRRAYDVDDGYFEYGGIKGMPGFVTGTKVHDYYIASLSCIIPFFESVTAVNPAFSLRVAIGQRDEISDLTWSYDEEFVHVFSALKPLNVGVEGALVASSDIVDLTLAVGYEFLIHQLSLTLNLK